MDSDSDDYVPPQQSVLEECVPSQDSDLEEYVPPQYELFYPPNRGTGEPLRWFFSVCNIAFKDTIVKFKTTPDQLVKTFYKDQKWPLLVVEGKIPVTQAPVIARYLSILFDTVPDDPFLAYRVDQVCDIVEECCIITNPFVMEAMRSDLLNGRDEVPLEERLNGTILISQAIGQYIEQLYGIMNERDGDYLLGDKITYADVYLAHTIDVWDTAITLEFMNQYKEYFRKYKDKIVSLPQIQEWVKNHPVPIFDVYSRG